MALGNANTTAQARGKNKATKIKKRKEVEAAANYIAFQGSAIQSGPACSVSNGSVNITYYHNQALSSIPMLAGTSVYTEKRVNSRYNLADGHYKIGPDKGRYFSMEIRAGVLRGNATPC